jgi:hypothetical protein
VKYQFECTEAETLAYIAAAGQVLDKTLAFIERRIAAATFVSATPEPVAAAAPQAEAPHPSGVVWGDLRVRGEPVSDLPLPSNKVSETVAPYTPPKASYADNAQLDGRTAFVRLVEEWRHNLGVEGAPQPNRGDLMRDFANGRHSYRALGFVAAMGGLMHACDHVEASFPDAPDYGTPEYQDKVRLLSTTICQVGSIFFHELSDLYEHRDIYRETK